MTDTTRPAANACNCASRHAGTFLAPGTAPAAAPARDPLRDLQAAATRAAEYVAGERAARVVVFGASGAKVLEVAVPLCCGEVQRADEPPGVAGWEVGDRAARFDGRVVPVSASRLKLLKVLVEAEGKYTAHDLGEIGFDHKAEEDSVRYHVGRLRAELKKAFPEWEGDPVPNDGGYRLALR